MKQNRDIEIKITKKCTSTTLWFNLNISNSPYQKIILILSTKKIEKKVHTLAYNFELTVTDFKVECNQISSFSIEKMLEQLIFIITSGTFVCTKT